VTKPPGSRRGCPRVPLRLEAAYEDPAHQVFLTTRDLSETGVYLLAAEPPLEGVAARVLLELPGHQAILRLHGVVARREPGVGFAVAFDREGMPGQANSTLREFTREKSPQPSQ
jgi:hypothetical protein